MKKPHEGMERTLAPGTLLRDEVDGTEFEVHDLVGRGGMGEVYRGTRLSDMTPCAVKCVRSDLIRNPTICLRTRFESKSFRLIDHLNVVKVLATGVRSDGVPWLAMEWLDGYTLAQIIELRGKIPLRWAIEIVRDLCRGLQAIHKHAIHRDIKPQNVHFGFDAITRALDLGTAKSKDANVHLTTTGFQVGTLPYMAPEQLDNTLGLDHRADLWAAIVVLYCLMAGIHPFALDDGTLTLARFTLGCSIIRDPHRPLLSVLPSAPPLFEQIFHRGLAKDPADRFRSAAELVEVLTAALDFLETAAGHAEPLSTFANELSAERGPVAPPSRIAGAARLVPPEPAPPLWLPPRTTVVMPPPTPRIVAPQAPGMPRVASTRARSTEPMPPPKVPPGRETPAAVDKDMAPPSGSKKEEETAFFDGENPGMEPPAKTAWFAGSGSPPENRPEPHRPSVPPSQRGQGKSPKTIESRPVYESSDRHKRFAMLPPVALGRPASRALGNADAAIAAANTDDEGLDSLAHAAPTVANPFPITDEESDSRHSEVREKPIVATISANNGLPRSLALATPGPSPVDEPPPEPTAALHRLDRDEDEEPVPTRRIPQAPVHLWLVFGKALASPRSYLLGGALAIMVIFAELLYLLVVWHRTGPRTEPMVVPVGSVAMRMDEPAPAQSIMTSLTPVPTASAAARSPASQTARPPVAAPLSRTSKSAPGSTGSRRVTFPIED